MNTKIREFIEGQLVDDSIELLNSDNLIELGYVDSLFTMNIMSFLEDEFNILIDIEGIDIKNFFTVDNIVEYIQLKQEDGHIR